MPEGVPLPSRPKIAFHLTGGSHWQFGPVHLEGLPRALRETYGAEPRLCVLVSPGEKRPPASWEGLPDEVVPLRAFPRGSPAWLVSRRSHRLLGRDLTTDRILKRRGVDVVALGDTRFRSRLPNIAWIHDFQHRHLPEMFSERERRERDRWFLQTARRATRVLLLSRSVREDFAAFAPRCAGKGRVVAPVSYIPAAIYETDPRETTVRYGLPERFVYLPNAFMKHKNHALAFRAVQALKQQGTEVFLACSGYQSDYRHPAYFPGLLQEIGRLGIDRQVALLGPLPHGDVLRLMRQSVCVLNPSLFEGYGMSIDEARSLGKRVLLSDIAAHREQGPPAATYFDPRDVAGLAGKLREAWDERRPGPDPDLEREARRSLPERRERYARSFMAVVEEISSRPA